MPTHEDVIKLKVKVNRLMDTLDTILDTQQLIIKRLAKLEE